MKTDKNKQVLWSAVIVIICLTAFVLVSKPQTPVINEVGVTDLAYGDVTIEGILIKDSPAEKEGSYYLVLPDMRTILLTSTNIDAIIGKKVLASGLLSPSLDPSIPMVMVVNEIIVKE